jgi:hypothetical protein
MVDKDRARELYRACIWNLPDSISSDPFRRQIFWEGVNKLKKMGAWWHYKVIVRKYRDYARYRGYKKDKLQILENLVNRWANRLRRSKCNRK